MIIAKRRLGKTILALNLIKFLTDTYSYHCIILFSDTIHVENNNAFEFIDRRFCFHSSLMDIKIEKLIDF